MQLGLPNQSRPYCAGCHQPIVHEATITALNHTWHAACFRCADCGKPIGQARFYAHEGRPYHEACYHARLSPRCARCGQPIIGEYTTALGKTWHPSHFVCAHCGQTFDGRGFYERNGQAYCRRDLDELFGQRCAMGELLGQNRYFEKNGQTYCETHYWQTFGKRCAIGAEILKGSYQTNTWGDTYCAEHQRGLPDCFSCGRPICERLTGGGGRYQDGRWMCNRCRRTAIEDVRPGQAILAEVRAFLARCGLDIGAAPTPLQLASQDELTRRSSKAYAQKPAGMACHQSTTRNGQIVERRVEAILILYGLPHEHFAAIAAHELMHTYLFMNAFPDLEPVVEEGLCELAEYLWLKQQGTPEAAYRLGLMNNNDNPVYGKGLQLARRSLDKTPLLTLLDTVQKRGRFP